MCFGQDLVVLVQKILTSKVGKGMNPNEITIAEILKEKRLCNRYVGKMAFG